MGDIVNSEKVLTKLGLLVWLNHLMTQLNFFQRSLFFLMMPILVSILLLLFCGLFIVLITFSVFPFKESRVSIRLSVIFIYLSISFCLGIKVISYINIF